MNDDSNEGNISWSSAEDEVGPIDINVELDCHDPKLPQILKTKSTIEML